MKSEAYLKQLIRADFDSSKSEEQAQKAMQAASELGFTSLENEMRCDIEFEYK